MRAPRRKVLSKTWEHSEAMSTVDSQGLRQLIREVLVDELGRLRRESGAFAQTTPTPQVREETVEIRSSADLMAFARRLLEVSKDGRACREIESGRWIFRLAGGSAGGMRPVTSPGAHSASAGGAVRFDHGLVSERQVDGIPPGTERLILGKRVRLTPLARDRIRQRAIRIERTT